MASSGLCLTLNTSEWRNDAAVSSLSHILEESPAPKYWLSQKACSEILNRAAQRGRQLPPLLLTALEQGAGLTTMQPKQDT
jgi:hypothetical protein